MYRKLLWCRGFPVELEMRGIAQQDGILCSFAFALSVDGIILVSSGFALSIQAPGRLRRRAMIY